MPGIERFADKAFGARLAAYPVMMLLVPAIWWLAVKRRRPDAEPPYVAFALIMLGFLVDTTGNSLDLYDSVAWWDDSNHFVNWFFLLAGLGLIIARDLEPRVGPDTAGHRARLPAGARLGARRVVHVHPARHRARHRLRGHPR